jgi:thiol-disulfide isomerase/thioredoxin
MAIPRKGLQVAAVLLLIAGYCLLLRYAFFPKAPRLTPEDVQQRQPFPTDFALLDLQGQPVHLSTLRGQVVLLNFWASWCYPCRVEMPSMQALYQEHRSKGFTILAIASDTQGQAIVRPFVEQYRLTFPVLLDPDDIVGTRLGLQGLPTSYLLDRQGQIVRVELGARDWNSPAVRHLLALLLAENPSAATP